jgi:putative phage-type endonuclease
MDRELFLESRRSGIGSSDVAAILGICPWRTPLHVYRDKLGLAQDPNAPMDPHLEWGIRLEPVIAAKVKDQYGWELVKVPKIMHRQHNWLIANIDRLRLADGSNQICEFKTTALDYAQQWGEPDTAEIPLYYWIQVQHQLAVLHESYEVLTAWVFVLIGGSDFRRYRVEYDPTFLDTVINPLAEFWQKVQQKTPPEPTYSHKNTLSLLNDLYQPEPNKAIRLVSDQALALADEYQRCSLEIAEHAKLREEIKARLVAMMGDAGHAELPDGRVLSRRSFRRKAYSVPQSTYIDFRIKQPTSVVRNSTAPELTSDPKFSSFEDLL